LGLKVSHRLYGLGLFREVLADTLTVWFRSRDPPRLGPGRVLERRDLEVMDLFRTGHGAKLATLLATAKGELAK
ncbi:MAG: hypothetical protein MUF86_13955, partial [Akkermansiaceae bacterium]|nr:hypothetical protein [Akkermansiaceae bacterium]